jgi:hypothetical protein
MTAAAQLGIGARPKMQMAASGDPDFRLAAMPPLARRRCRFRPESGELGELCGARLHRFLYARHDLGIDFASCPTKSPRKPDGQARARATSRSVRELCARFDPGSFSILDRQARRPRSRLSHPA